MSNNLNIAITGTAPAELKNLACGVVYDALVANGFTDVGLIDGTGQNGVKNDTATLLDWVNKHDASLFNTPITVINSPYVDHNATVDKAFIAGAIAQAIATETDTMIIVQAETVEGLAEVA